MLIQPIQQALQVLYCFELEQSVEDFLLDESFKENYWLEFPWLKHSKENLLVWQSENELEVGLCLSPELQAFNHRHDWTSLVEEIQQTQIGEARFRTWVFQLGALIEGVSHFVYLMQRAEVSQPVSAFELELQAEVDRFLIFSQILPQAQWELLYQCLFIETKWIQELSSDESSRYQNALQLAAKYCGHLLRTYLHAQRLSLLYPEIRKFYRLSQHQKLSWIGV